MSTLTLSTRQASLAVFFAAVLWGIYWVPLRSMTDQGIEGAWAVVAIHVPAGLVCGLWLWRNWAVERPHLHSAFWIAVFAAIGMGFYAMALTYTSVVRATLFFYLMPIWGTFIGVYFLGEAWSWQRWGAIALGVLGLVLMLGGNKDIPFNGGDLLAFLSGVGWAIAGSLIKRAGQIPIAGMLTLQFLLVGLIALAIGSMFEPVGLPMFTGVGSAWIIAILVSVLAVLPAVAAVFWASQFLFPGRVGLLLMAEVFVAVVTASWFIPDEVLTPLQWVAVVLIISASFVEMIPNRQRRA